MPGPKNILVTTTSTVQNLEVKQYLKPISAQIVAGAGVLSDFAASFSDLFGSRSTSYQKRVTALYDEAITKLKRAAFEIGANGILGLSINIAEITGKGKEMFMLTAVGTAVIIEGYVEKSTISLTEKFENVGLDKLNMLKKKRHLLARAANIIIDDEIWDFMITYEVHEMFPYVVAHLRKQLPNPEIFDKAYKRTVDLVHSLPEDQKLNVLYTAIIKENNILLADKLISIVETLHLLDFNHINEILQLQEFERQKRALRLIMYNKPFYNKEDVEKFRSFIILIKEKFAGKSFKADELTPEQAIAKVEEKISLILDFLV